VRVDVLGGVICNDGCYSLQLAVVFDKRHGRRRRNTRCVSRSSSNSKWHALQTTFNQYKLSKHRSQGTYSLRSQNIRYNISRKIVCVLMNKELVS